MTRAGLKSLVWVVVVWGAALAFWVLLLEPNINDDSWSERVLAGIRSLPAKRPADVPQGQWEFMVVWTMNLDANCGYSPHWVSREQRWRFLREFEERLQGPVDAATIDWIWDEYARNSRGGQSYSDRYRPTRSPDLKFAQPGDFVFPNN